MRPHSNIGHRKIKMKTTHLIAALIISVSAASAADGLSEVAKAEAELSRMDLAILQRSVALLGGNHRSAAPKFSRMIYDDQEKKIIQFFTIKEDQIDKVLARDKQAQQTYEDQFQAEYMILRNYLNIWGEDYPFDMHFSSVGGDRGFVVNRAGIRDRNNAQQAAAQNP
jgi:hypothetical protein